MRTSSLWLLLAVLASVAGFFQVDDLIARILLGSVAVVCTFLWVRRLVLSAINRHKRPHHSYYGRMPEFELPTASEAEVV